ncbi:MAG: phosphoenolpyruvate carboxylase, partial [Chloroflexota bacterium]
MDGGASRPGVDVRRDHDADRLSRDVSTFGRLLGEVLREQEGDDGFTLVEEFRARTKELRGPTGALDDFGAGGQALLERTSTLTADQMDLVVRAFTAYFHLVNMAEEHHRLRVLRQREVAGGGDPRGESIHQALAEAAGASVPPDAVRALLRVCVVEPVFTAHPTEARRRTVLDKLRRLSELAERLDDARWPPGAVAALFDKFREEITALWLTEEVRQTAPTVLDEVRNGLYYFEESLWDVAPRLYRDLEAALAATYPQEAFDVPAFLRFGSWIGGDRDGNPAVTAAVTERTLRLHKETTLGLYERSLAALQRHLSVAASSAEPGAAARSDDDDGEAQPPAAPGGISAALEESLAADAAAMPELAAALGERFASEPYRRKLAFMRARV